MPYQPLEKPDTQSMVQEYQSGITELKPEESVGFSGMRGMRNLPSNPTPQEPSETSQEEELTPEQRAALRTLERDSSPFGGAFGGTYQTNTEEALSENYGISRYDKTFNPDTELQNARAHAQSSFSKIGTGLMKGGVTAASTFVNSTAGLVFGVGSALFELAADNNGNGRSFMDTVEAGVNNDLSKFLIGIQDAAEKIMPNYRTTEEQSEKYQKEWWKHMGTANFIGDSFIKNLGFTVGAIYGGKVWADIIGKGLSAISAGRLFKGISAAATGDAEATAAVGRAAQAVGRGTAIGVDADAMVANGSLAARILNNKEPITQWTGAILGAMGEGTVEGVMAKKEFIDDYTRNLQMQYNSELANLENKLISENNPRFVQTRTYKDSPTSRAYDKTELTQEGIYELEDRQRELQTRYRRMFDAADQAGNRLASTTYLLNLPILATSNTIQFGRFFTGGYKSVKKEMEKKIGKGLTGGLKIAERVGENGKYLAPEITGEYVAKGGLKDRLKKTVFGSLKVGASEAAEEMLQGAASSGSREVANNRLAEFTNNGYDELATRTFGEWLSDMGLGAGEYLGDTKNWQEGAIGALTGLLGLPGWQQGHFSWNGGVIGEYLESKHNEDVLRKSAESLNKIVKDPDFQNRFHAWVRHQAYDRGMEQAAEANDEYAWHSNDDASLINYVISFADAGKLNDLYDIADAYAQISPEQAAAFQRMLQQTPDSSRDGFSAFDKEAAEGKLTPAELAEKIKGRANDIKKTIQQYKDIYDDVYARLPVGTRDELDAARKRELIFTAEMIKKFEDRFMSIFGETMEAIDKYKGFDQITQSGTDKDVELSATRSALERFFAGSIPMQMTPAQMELSNKAIKELEGEIEKTGDTELKKKVEDMKKLSQSRNAFYRKYRYLLTEDGMREFAKQAITSQKVEEKAEEVQAEMETDSLDSLQKVKDYFNSKTNAIDREAAIRGMHKLADGNEHIKKFLEMKSFYDNYVSTVAAREARGYPTVSESEIPDNLKLPFRFLGRLIIPTVREEIFNNAESIEDLQQMPDSVIPSIDWFKSTASRMSPLGVPAGVDALYKIIIDGVKREMTDYARTYNNLKGTGVLTQKVEKDDDTPIERGKIDGAPGGSTFKDDPAAFKTTEKKAEEKKQPVRKGDKEIKDALKRIKENKTDRGKANAIARYQTLKYSGVEITSEEDQVVSDTIKDLESRGMVITDMLGEPVAENSDAEITFVEDSSLEPEQNIVTMVETPELILNGKKIQRAKITVNRNTARVAVPFSGKPTVEAQAADAMEVEEDVENDKSEDAKKEPIEGIYKYPVLRMSVPEVANDACNAARRAGSSKERASVSLPDFVHEDVGKDGKVVVVNAGYKTVLPGGTKSVWDKLVETGAFKAVAESLDVGDELEFVILPDVGKYNGEPTIFVRRVSDKQILTPLLQGEAHEDDYYGLHNLRYEIVQAYRKRVLANPVAATEEFVWGLDSEGRHEEGTTSVVLQKRHGVIDYSTSTEFENENGVTEVDEYDPNAPIVFIDKDGNAHVVHGTDKDAANKVSENFAKPERNRGEIARAKDGLKLPARLGNLYYLAKFKDGEGHEYTPIRLFVEHFREGNKTRDNEMFRTIREKINAIQHKAIDVISRYNKEMLDADKAEESQKNALRDKAKNNLEQGKKELHTVVGELRPYLDIRDIMFDIVEHRDGTQNLQVVTGYVHVNAASSEEDKIRAKQAQTRRLSLDELNTDQNILIDHIAKEGKPIQIKFDSDSETIEGFETLLEQGLITTNAKKMRPKNADFYFLSMNENTGAIEPDSQKQREMYDEAMEYKKSKSEKKSTPSEQEVKSGKPAEKPKPVSASGALSRFEKSDKKTKQPQQQEPVQPDTSSGTDVETAKRKIIAKGRTNVSNFIEAVRSFRNRTEDNAGIVNDLETFSTILESVFSLGEKVRIALALDNLFGVSGEYPQVDVFATMYEYNYWFINNTLRGGKHDKLIEAAFERVRTVLDSDIVEQLESTVDSMSDEMADYIENKNGERMMDQMQIFEHDDFYALEDMSHLPKDVQDYLKSEGWSEETFKRKKEYEPDQFDKALRCKFSS